MNLSLPTKHLSNNFNIFTFFSIFILFFGFQAPDVFAHENESENVVIIHVDEGGFEPNKATIKPGTKVTFENVGKEEHWPASDDHPNHTLYDGTSIEEHCNSGSFFSFDACSSILPGELWSFVFEKEDIYKYHDHLWPHLGGEITVKNSDNETAENKSIFSRLLDFLRKIFFMVSSFFTSNNEDITLNSGDTENKFYEILKERFENIVLQSDPREAINILEKESAQNAKVSALCHDVLHKIGHTAYDKYGSFEGAVSYQDDFCNSGYIHGIFESYFESTDNQPSDLPEQCNDYAANKRPFDLWQCHHGIGHGFMYLTGGDLDKSLALCKQGLGRGSAASCQNGVYMEVFNLEILAKEKGVVDPKNPFSTCSTRDVAKSDCYLYVPTYLSQTIGMDFSDIFNECNTAEFGYKSSCIRGIGSEAIKRNMNNVHDVFTLCRQAGSYINQETCVAGVVGMYMNQEGSYFAGKRLCENVPQDYQDACDRTVNSKEAFFR